MNSYRAVDDIVTGNNVAREFLFSTPDVFQHLKSPKVVLLGFNTQLQATDILTFDNTYFEVDASNTVITPQIYFTNLKKVPYNNVLRQISASNIVVDCFSANYFQSGVFTTRELRITIQYTISSMFMASDIDMYIRFDDNEYDGLDIACTPLVTYDSIIYQIQSIKSSKLYFVGYREISGWKQTFLDFTNIGEKFEVELVGMRKELFSIPSSGQCIIFMVMKIEDDILIKLSESSLFTLDFFG
jgi:hypothetical protein